MTRVRSGDYVRIKRTADNGAFIYTHPNGPTTNPTLLHLDHVHVSYKDSP